MTKYAKEDIYVGTTQTGYVLAYGKGGEVADDVVERNNWGSLVEGTSDTKKPKAPRGTSAARAANVPPEAFTEESPEA